MGYFLFFCFAFLFIKTILDHTSSQENQTNDSPFMNSGEVWEAIQTFDFQIIKDKLPYYSLLTSHEVMLFKERVLYYYHNLIFEGIDGMDISHEVKTLFAGHCAQITFGYNDYQLESLKRIIIFPHLYYSRLFNAEVKGLTMANKNTFISWNGLLEGVKDPHDKVNLGLHELAHSLKIEAEDYPTSWSLEDWLETAHYSFRHIENDPDDSFRAYGLTNFDEMWAVSVEYFFEKPHEFKNKFPLLYRATKKVLNQNIPERMAIQ